MDQVLLVIPTPVMRQLYHDLLLDDQYEIVIVDNLTSALGFMVVESFSNIVVFSRGQTDLDLFLKIRKKKKNWSKTKLILVTDNRSIYQKNLRKNDEVISYSEDLVQVVKQIREAIL